MSMETEGMLLMSPMRERLSTPQKRPTAPLKLTKTPCNAVFVTLYKKRQLPEVDGPLFHQDCLVKTKTVFLIVIVIYFVIKYIKRKL